MYIWMNYCLKLSVCLHLLLRAGLARLGYMLSLKMSIINARITTWNLKSAAQ